MITIGRRDECRIDARVGLIGLPGKECVGNGTRVRIPIYPPNNALVMEKGIHATLRELILQVRVLLRVPGFKGDTYGKVCNVSWLVCPSRMDG